MQASTVDGTVQGTTEPGFEGVRAAFEAHAGDVGRGGAAFAATVGGRLVVDLWSGRADEDRPWAADTPAALFSATKGLVATCIALLHDRGELDVDQPVARYWPAFAAEGKGGLTVRQVLAHTCGLTEVPGYADLLGLDGRGHAEHDEIRRRLAGSTPQWAPGTGIGYHVMTYGYLAGTIIELVDGRPLARFFDEEIGGPLGLDLRIGASDEVLARKSTTLDPDPLPDDPMGAVFEALLALARDESTMVGRACIAQGGSGVLDQLAALGNSPATLRAGVGSGDGVGTARAVAELYGRLVDPEPHPALPSAATLESVTRIELQGLDAILQVPNAYGVGFGRTASAAYAGTVTTPDGPRPIGPSEGTFGHGGAGGQLGFADPVGRIGIGFTRSHLAHITPLAPALVGSLYEALAS